MHQKSDNSKRLEQDLNLGLPTELQNIIITELHNLVLDLHVLLRLSTVSKLWQTVFTKFILHQYKEGKIRDRFLVTIIHPFTHVAYNSWIPAIGPHFFGREVMYNKNYSLQSKFLDPQWIFTYTCRYLEIIIIS